MKHKKNPSTPLLGRERGIYRHGIRHPAHCHGAMRHEEVARVDGETASLPCVKAPYLAPASPEAAVASLGQ